MNSNSEMGNTTPTTSSPCRIVVVGPKNGDDCLTELRHLPPEAVILATGSSMEELEKDGPLYTEANVLLNVTGNAAILAPIIDQMPFLTWIHSITAGVDHILCPSIVNSEDITLTNAKGIYSSSLGEYVIGACMYFAKDFHRLNTQKSHKEWNRFNMKELKNSTMGIIGYGDIGYACAKLAKAFGMNVVALRRRPNLSQKDTYIDEVYGPNQLNDLMAVSDYVVVALALTPETKHFINSDTFKHCKPNQVLINIARGPVIDENALISALSDGTLLGAALDVFTTEPLPTNSKLWELPNVLLSPHNADKTIDFRHNSIKFFTENCKRFIQKEPLECMIDKVSGY